MKGQNTLVPCGPDLNEAKKTFEKKFYDKTRNAWDERSNFEKVAGKYDMLEMDYSAKASCQCYHALILQSDLNNFIIQGGCTDT